MGIAELKRSNAEVICSFMEPRPKYISQSDPDQWNHRWWKWYCNKESEYLPRELTLGALREVQERLSDEQWFTYIAALTGTDDPFRMSILRMIAHATAEQKIDALAAVLRSSVEAVG